ncbi:MAG: hypothetical protein ACYCZY_00280 [Lacisediminihabitans sp.]
MAKKRWITPALALVAALAIGLAGGVLIGHGSAASARTDFGTAVGGASGGNPAGGFASTGGGRFTSGTIASINGGTIVIKTADGRQKTVKTAPTTNVTKTVASSVSGLKAGQTITVVGATDSSGTVTATVISEGAALRRGFGRPGGAGGVPTPGPSVSGN